MQLRNGAAIKLMFPSACSVVFEKMALLQGFQIGCFVGVPTCPTNAPRGGERPLGKLSKIVEKTFKYKFKCKQSA